MNFKNIKKIINSDKAYNILDNSNCANSTWTEGGCAILSRALNIIGKYPIYIIYNEKYKSPEHFGIITSSGSIFDADGEHENLNSWLNFFKNNEFPREGNLITIPYDSNIDMGEIKFDEKASIELAELIKELIVCNKCGWSWKKSQSDISDLYVCHKCGHDNSKEYKSIDEHKIIREIIRKIINENN